MSSTSPASFVEFARAAVEQSLAARFEQQAARHGSRTAVAGAGRDITYEELDARAGGMAAAILDRAGARPGPVALLLAHGASLPAAIFGVLKAGGCLVPLDPAHPAERNAFIVADSGARLLLTDRRHRDAARTLAARMDANVQVLDIADAPGTGTAARAATGSPRDLCLLVYTSGSTGRPKGVCQTHRNLLHAAMTLTNFTELRAADRISLLHPLSAIAGATTLFAALLNGAAICPFALGERSLDQLVLWLEQEELTCLSAVPTVLRRLGARLRRGHRFEDIRLVRLVGEAATLGEWRLLAEHFPGHCRLYVGLGSTEALSIRQALYGRDSAPTSAVLAAGGAVPDKEVTLIAADGGEAAVGDVGEIAVRSEFLFPGYWRRPELTAQVLSHDPAGRLPPLFRTGDLGRFTADGSLVHIGRADAQVKIAGQRVEIAEVEHAIRRATAARDAAVVLRRAGGHEGQLAAFVATGGAAPPDRQELRARLRESLPGHMIPVTIDFVAELPLLPGGKIDRKALADHAAAGRAVPVAPSNPIEETLVEIFQRAVGLQGIGVRDDLFHDLHGDSLAAVHILSEIRALLGRELPLRALLEASCVSALAKHLLDEGWRPPESSLLALHREGARPPLFGVCGAFGHALRLLLVGNALGPEQPFYGLQPPGMDWGRAGCATIEAMAAHYRREICRVQPRGPYRLLGTSFGGVVVFEIAVQFQQAGETIALLAMVDTMPPEDPAENGGGRCVQRDWAAGIDTRDPLVGMGVRAARIHQAALRGYRPRTLFDGSIVYYRCEEPAVPAALDRRPRWSRLATGGMHIVPVPGCHGHFHREPQFSALTEHLRSHLGPGERRPPHAPVNVPGA
jgi:amino acid adenylation domain-containing protein